jgi:Rrf2 family protein
MFTIRVIPHAPIPDNYHPEMKMSESVEWAAHCAVLLAVLPEGSSLPASRLAEYHGVPGPYLAKSLQALMRAGIVESRAGRNGGYRLARPAGEITLYDVIEAIEGDGPFFRCTEIRRRGPTRVAASCYPPTCGIAESMWRAERRWRSSLEGVTVAGLAAGVAAQAPPAAIAKGVRWLSTVRSS